MLKINRIVRLVAALIMVAALCFAFYEIGQRVGRSEAKVQIIEKEREVVRYVERKKEAIRSQPNAGRDKLLQQFSAGVL